MALWSTRTARPTCRVQLDTLISIYAQLTQQKVIRSNHVHKRNMQAYCNR